MGVVAFWIAVAAVLIAGGWFKSRSEAQKQETLRKIIEKTGTVDEGLLRELFPRPPAFDPSAWGRMAPRGVNYRALRVLGTIAMCVAVGLILFFTPLWQVGGKEDAMVGVAIGVVTFASGVGFFLASRFAEPPARVEADRRSVG
jgi:hypothetical protein